MISSKFLAKLVYLIFTYTSLIFSQTLIAETTHPTLLPSFEGLDKSTDQIHIKLTPVAAGLKLPTDIQFHPDHKTAMIVLEKNGTAKIVNLFDKKIVTEHKLFFKLDVNSSSELGLLGLAFHPDFYKNKTLVLNYTPKTSAGQKSRISKWRVNNHNKVFAEKIIMELEQPFANHNAGQLAFGADKNLYIGWGDGGSGGDPQHNGQNLQTFLGKMLRINIDTTSVDKAYSIPSDNPFINNKDILPEIWAIGFRNPWRYSFDNQQRLIVADVGQNKWEELDLVEKGLNYGWSIKEGSHCFSDQDNCNRTDLIDPIFEYGREDGACIVGGYVYNGQDPKLKNKYICADFVSGQIWALDLPNKYIPNQSKAIAHSLGKFNLAISTFGRDADGNVYLSDIKTWTIYKIDRSDPQILN